MARGPGGKRHLRLVTAEPAAQEAARAAPAQVASPVPSPIGQFQVHGVLQAARARLLGLDLAAAKSWGLNRAIFHEALKKGYIRRGGRAGSGAEHGKFSDWQRAPERKQAVFYTVGGEKAYLAPGSRRSSPRFMIGGKTQTSEQFDRQIARRFPDWNRAWEDAIAILRSVNPSTLRSASRFHRNVVRVQRDELAAKWALFPRAKAVSEARAA